jgi:deglycase
MENKLNDKKVAIVVANGFEESEFTKPLEALKEAGASVDVISLKKGNVKSWSEKNWSNEYPVDKTIDEVDSHDYDALVLPGGVMNPDQLRTNADVIGFVAGFFDDGKPIAAICHGPWTLIETGELNGRKVTSYPSIKSDLINAGAEWVDEEVVVDNGLVTSRSPNDLPAFCKKMVEEIAEGVHQE